MTLLLGRDLDEAKFDHQLLQGLELVLLLVGLRFEWDVLLNQLVQFLIQELLLVFLFIPGKEPLFDEFVRKIFSSKQRLRELEKELLRVADTKTINDFITRSRICYRFLFLPKCLPVTPGGLDILNLLALFFVDDGLPRAPHSALSLVRLPLLAGHWRAGRFGRTPRFVRVQFLICDGRLLFALSDQGGTKIKYDTLVVLYQKRCVCRYDMTYVTF